MELVRGVFVVMMLAGITLIVLNMLNAIAAWYENQARPLIVETVNNTSMGLRGEPVNASEYDLWEKSKPYLQPLDIALALAFLAGLLAVFIHTRERS